MRSDKELLQIVIDSLRKGSKEGWYNYGICGEITDLYRNLYISSKERSRLEVLIETNKPTKTNEFKELTENEYWVGGSYYWGIMYNYPETRFLRIAYLEKLQKLLLRKTKNMKRIINLILSAIYLISLTCINFNVAYCILAIIVVYNSFLILSYIVNEVTKLS